jgi:hypothetical protein
VARALQCASALSLLNAVPLVVLAALGASTVAPAAAPGGTLLWATGALLVVGATHLLHVWFRVAWARRSWGVVLGIGAAAVLPVGADVLGGAGLRAASTWLFGGLRAGRLLPLVGLAGASVVAGVGAATALRRFLYVEGDGAARAPRPRRGPVGSYARGLPALVRLEGRLLVRTRGPRELVLAGGAVTVFVVGLILEGALPLFSQVLAPFMIGVTGSVAYGQYAFAWHGGHFDGLLARTSPRRLVRAPVLVLGGLAVLPILLAMPVVGGYDAALVGPFAAFALYHAGVTVPVVVATALRWNRTWVPPEQSRFSVTGGSLRGFVVMVGLAGPPALLFAMGGVPVVLGGVAGLGLVGLATAPRWLSRLATALERRRHALLRGFRGGWQSPHEWHW